MADATASDRCLVDDQTLASITAAVATRRPELARALRVKFGVAELGLFDSDDDYTRIVAAQVLAKLLVDAAGDVVSAARLLGATARAVEHWPENDPRWAATMPTLITGYAGLAVDAGLGAELRADADRWLALLERLGNSTNVDDLRLKLVEILLNDGRYEHALGLMDKLTRPLASYQEAIRARLYTKIGTLLTRPDEPLPPIDGPRILRLTLDHLQRVAGDHSATISLAARPLDELEQGDLGLPAFPVLPKSLEDLDARSRQLAGHRSPLMALQAVAQAAGALLAPAGANADALATIAAAADRAMAAADALGYWEMTADVAWIAVVADRRAGRHSAAVDRMLAIVERLEARRRLIEDPRLRAGLAVYFPQLPWALAESAALAGRPETALFGIELTKARILGDLRLVGRSATDTPAAFAEALRGHWPADRPVPHLLAFLFDAEAPASDVDQSGVRATLLTAAGDLHVREIALAPASVRGVADTIDALVRGKGRHIGKIFDRDPGRRPFQPWLAVLAPLVAWLEPLLEAGELRRGDTIVYSADGALHNIPLAMVPFAGAALIDAFALAAMPSLALAAADSPAPTPSSAIAILAPRPSERERGETYAWEAAQLAALIPTTVVRAIEDVPARPWADLVHIAAHGEFEPHNPLRGGGLTIGSRDGHYDERDPRQILRPEDLAAVALPGMHVTMRACLVGQVRQITSREPLGAVWGTLAAGAASVVAASWTVSISSAARWCALFYEAWIGRGLSRAAAHREATLALRAEGGAFAHPAHWAPFVLYLGTLEGDCA